MSLEEVAARFKNKAYGSNSTDEPWDEYWMPTRKYDDMEQLALAYPELKAENEQLKIQNADANLLLGNGWEQVVEIAKGPAGLVTALNIQCTKLSGDIAVLKDDFIQLAKDHYWNSLEPHKDLIILHLEGILKSR